VARQIEVSGSRQVHAMAWQEIKGDDGERRRRKKKRRRRG
jgi:hypothetical protein